MKKMSDLNRIEKFIDKIPEKWYFLFKFTILFFTIIIGVSDGLAKINDNFLGSKILMVGCFLFLLLYFFEINIRVKKRFKFLEDLEKRLKNNNE